MQCLAHGRPCQFIVASGQWYPFRLPRALSAPSWVLVPGRPWGGWHTCVVGSQTFPSLRSASLESVQAFSSADPRRWGAHVSRGWGVRSHELWGAALLPALPSQEQVLVSISPAFYLNLRACYSTNEDILYRLENTQQNSNSVRFKGMSLIGAASEIRKAGDTALLWFLDLSRSLVLAVSCWPWA